jgi:hypothetical protein
MKLKLKFSPNENLEVLSEESMKNLYGGSLMGSGRRKCKNGPCTVRYFDSNGSYTGISRTGQCQEIDYNSSVTCYCDAEGINSGSGNYDKRSNCWND